MSSDISYIIKAIDNFSETFKKFNADIGKVNSNISQSSGQFTKLGLISTKTLKDTSGNITGTSQKFRDFNGNINTVTQSFGKAESAASGFGMSLKNMAVGAGVYFGTREVIGFGKELFNTRVQMDSMTASLTAILPKFDKTKSGTQLAAEEIEYLKEATTRLGTSFEVALPSYMQFLAGSKESLERTRRNFEAFAGISRMYGINSQRFGLVVNALSQMQSKGVVSMEELRQQLGDSLPGALNLFAEASGYSTAEFTKLVSEGKIGAGIISRVADLIQKRYGVDIVNASKTLGAETEKLGNQWLFFKDTLSQQFAPAMSSTVAGLTNLTTGLASVFKAMNNQTAFKKLDSDAQALVTTLQVVSGFLGGMVDSIKFIGEGFGILIGTARNVVSAGTIAAMGAGSAITGDKSGEMAASGAMSQLWEGTKQLWTGEQQPQKVEVQVNFDNVPQGAKVEVRTPPSGKNIKLGTQVNNAK
jgi:hypothetical protein